VRVAPEQRVDERDQHVAAFEVGQGEADDRTRGDERVRLMGNAEGRQAQARPRSRWAMGLALLPTTASRSIPRPQSKGGIPHGYAVAGPKGLEPATSDHYQAWGTPMRPALRPHARADEAGATRSWSARQDRPKVKRTPANAGRQEASVGSFGLLLACRAGLAAKLAEAFAAEARGNNGNAHGSPGIGRVRLHTRELLQTGSFSERALPGANVRALIAPRRSPVRVRLAPFA